MHTAAVAGDWVVAEGAKATTAAAAVVISGAAGSGWSNISTGAAGGQVLVRYGWETLPFEYKQAGVYAAREGFPAGPFVLSTTTIEKKQRQHHEQ